MAHMIEDPSHIETHDLPMHKYKNGIDIYIYASFLFFFSFFFNLTANF